MSNKVRGLTVERLAKKQLAEEGYAVSRARGSFGLFDVMAMNSEKIRLIQVKRVKGKYYSFRSEIEQISIFKGHPANVVKELWIYADRMEGRKSGWIEKKVIE